ncbi:unnamed protein product, partial [Didymodactylos carnosus]
IENSLRGFMNCRSLVEECLHRFEVSLCQVISISLCQVIDLSEPISGNKELQKND